MPYVDPWKTLPVVARLGTLEIQSPRSLVLSGQAQVLEDMSAAAWGHLADCGWEDAWRGAGPMLDEQGQVRPRWLAAFKDTVKRLAQEGSCAGPDGDKHHWASWICWTFSQPKAWVESRQQGGA